MSRRSLSLWLGLLLAAAACKPSPTAKRPSRIALTPCRLEGVTREAVCGDYEVFEDRAKQSGRKIALHLAVIPALAPSPEPDPFVMLAGGPGQAATEAIAKVLPAFERISRRRDIVLVDQRGTGRSHPLDCETEDEHASLDEQLSSEQMDPEAIARCVKGYDADVRLYTTPIAMDDLDEVRDALGYEKVNLWGGSYGTRAALVYLRQHGDRVRSVVLDGVAPTGMVLPVSFAQDGQRALTLLLDACAKDPACGKAFPNLAARFGELLAKFSAGKQAATVVDPLSGKREAVHVSKTAFTSGLRGLLYAPELASLVPMTLDRAIGGDFSPFVAQSRGFSGGLEKSISLGMFFSIVCSEDVPLVKPEDVVSQTKDTFLGDGFVKEMLRVCAAWPKGTLPEGYADPVRSDVPVLLLSGDLDPVTPPRHAETAKATLSRSVHLVVPGVGHGASYLGCMPRLISEFVERASPDGLEASCLQSLKRPPFVVSFAGTTP